MSQSLDPDPEAQALGAVRAAEIAVGEGELDTAEDALLKALSDVRKAKPNNEEETT